MEDNPNSCKLILVGEAFVGKTSIIKRYIDDKFSNWEPTIGAQFFNKNIRISNGTQYFVNIWDTAGAEKYRSINKCFYRNASIALLIYDITNRKSFDELINFWYSEINDVLGDNVVIGLIGNKSDLFAQEEVDEEEARKFAKENDFVFRLCSALDGSGIDEVFQEVLEKLDKLIKKSGGKKRYSVAKHFKLKNNEDDEEISQKYLDKYENAGISGCC